MPIARLPSACTLTGDDIDRSVGPAAANGDVFRLTRHDDDVRAVLRELHAARLAKSLRSAGNDRNSACKVEIHSVPLGSRNQDVRLLRFAMSPLDGESQEA